MKLLSGQDLLTMIIKKEDTSNIWVGQSKDIKGSIKSPGQYFTMLPLKGHLDVTDIFDPNLVILDLKGEKTNSCYNTF